jgi:hypothetical protein
MISIISGAVIAGVGAFGLWSFMPKNGVTHRLVTVPFLDSVIPTVIVATLAVGISLIIAGIVS